MYLGIDVGTSSVKAVAIDERGTVSEQASISLKVDRPFDLWSEQHPDAWWDACEGAILSLSAQTRSAIQAIGLAGQMHGACVLGGDDQPLRPAILWNDGRSFAECDELERRVPTLRAITGNLAMPGFTAPKLLWLQRHEPSVFGRISSVLLPKDYVRLCLTGERASDMSDSAGTLWLDVAARAWSAEMLQACDLPESAMPKLYEGPQITGRLRPELAARWGMEAVVVAAGGGDNAAGAVGIGVIGDGNGLISLGTSGVIFVATETFQPNPARAVHAFCHCLPSMWHQMSVHLSAASCIDWAARFMGLSGPAALFGCAAGTVPYSGSELFLPYLSGERTPHNNPHVRGAFLNLDHDSDQARLASAVIEGVAFAHADGLDALRETGTQVEELWVIGGGARSRAWGQILAAALDVRLIYGTGGEIGPALGAAKLAIMAATGARAEAVCSSPSVIDIILPDQALVDRLTQKRRTFVAAYNAIASLKGV